MHDMHTQAEHTECEDTEEECVTLLVIGMQGLKDKDFLSIEGRKCRRPTSEAGEDAKRSEV